MPQRPAPSLCRALLPSLLLVSTALPAAAQTDAALEHARRILRSTPLIDGHNDLPWTIREQRGAPRDVERYDLRGRVSGHTDLARLQQLYHPGMISGYEANVTNLRDLPAISETVASRLGYPLYTYTVYERYANLFEWLKLQQNIMPLLIITITVVAVFNIVSTLLVLIIEKTKEIGMLSALGLEPRAVSMVFMGQAFMISLVGIGLGNLFALGLSLFELRFHLITLPEKSYFIRHVPLEIDPLQYLAVSAGVAALTLLFAFIPSRVAASLRPSTALTT